MASTKFTYEANDKIAKHYDAPSEHVVSEGELLIKALAEKQSNTFIKLEEQLNQKKEFQKSTFVPVTAFTSGKSTLEEFIDCAEFVNSVEELKSLGLIQNEIEFILDSQRGAEFLFKKHKIISKTKLQEQLETLHTRIEHLKAIRQGVQERNDEIPRHIKDIALSVKPASDETKLYKFALSCSSVKSNSILNHPINNLETLERELFEHLDAIPVPPLKKRRKRAKKYLEENELNENNQLTITSYKDGTSKWDLKDAPPQLHVKREHVKTYTCKPQQFYTIKNNQIIKLNDVKKEETEKKLTDQKFIAGDSCENTVLSKEKLSEEEIRKMPRFLHYQRGIPSKILYVKNLANNTKEEDLVNIFSRFETEREKIVCRLLTGKMKGQAFITFHNINHATKCLEATNGLILKEKPIIIQYGKNKT